MEKRISDVVFYFIALIPFNGAGELTYYLVTHSGREARTVSVPNNYMLEVEQMGKCIINGETPVVNNEFSLLNASVMDRALDSIGYRR